MRNHTKTIAGITAAAGIAGAICALLYMQPGPRTPAAAASAPAKHADTASAAHACNAHAGSATTAMPPDTGRAPAPESGPAANHRLPSAAQPVVKPLGEVLRNVGPMDNWREFKPASITIAPVPELEAEFQMESVRTEHDRTIWTGRNPGLPGAFLVTVATEDTLHAAISYNPKKENEKESQVGTSDAVSET